MSLDNFALVKNGVTRRTSSWDRTGGNRDCFLDLKPGQIVTLLSEEGGPGIINHLWLTFREYHESGHDTVARDLVIRMYWDGATVPSVEAPLGDFFGLGHGLSPSSFYYPRKYTVQSLPVAIGGNERAFNCYWPMPFHQSARIEIFNNGLRTLRLLYFHVDYELGEQPKEAGLFHAAFGQHSELEGQIPGSENDYFNLDGKENLVLLETEGRGHYAGCFFYVDSDAESWWGEGDDMIFIDGDPMPTINGTGTEDYFNNAWGYNSAFCQPYYGAPLVEKRSDGGSFTSLYRFHIPDPIRFQKKIKVTIERWWSSRKTNAVSYVVFWYQQTPITARTPLPQGEANHPLRRIKDPEWLGTDKNLEIPLPSLEVQVRNMGFKVDPVSFIGGWDDLNSVGGLAIITKGRTFRLPLHLPKEGTYRVEVKPLYKLLSGNLEISLNGCSPVTVEKQTPYREADGPFILVGETTTQSKMIELTFNADEIAPLHRIRLSLLESPGEF